MKYKNVLVLGSGGTKGLAHIGILKRLEELKYKPDLIIGTSMGALIGALYASGKTAKEIEELLVNHSFKEIFDFGKLKLGFVKGDKILNVLNKYIKTNVKKLDTDLIVSSIDVNTGEIHYFKKGDVSSAVRKSISIPGIFQPVQEKNRIFVDAGFNEPIALEAIPMDAKNVIVVNVVDKIKKISKNYNVFSLTLQAFNINSSLNSKKIIKHFKEHKAKKVKLDYLSPDLSKYEVAALYSETTYKEIINKGYYYAKKFKFNSIIL